MTALWRQVTPLHPTFEPLNRCLEDDWFLLPFELKLQRGHAAALAAAAILSFDEHSAIAAAIDALEREWGREDPAAGVRARAAAPPHTDAEDLHTWVEVELTARAGAAGRKIHTARSRNDQVATLLKLYVIDAGRRWTTSMSEIQTAACDRAAAWADLHMPGMTHTQFAAPISAGFWMLRFAVAFDRVRRSLLERAAEWRRFCPLGSGALAGSSIPIDRSIQAAELGFDAPSLSALDSTGTRDECLELLSIASIAALHLQSLATDVILFCQTPLAWVRYPAAFGSGSSMMPNKLNPDAMELMRGGANSVIAAQQEAVLLLKGLPSGYNRDLQCIKPVLRRGVDALSSLLAMCGAFLPALEFDAERLGEAMRLGGLNATLRMEELVRGGAALRDAHHAVAAEFAASPDAGPEIATPLRRYVTVGSSHPEEVRRIAALLRTQAHSDTLK